MVNDRRVNAFTIPGGHIYANTGLLCAADSEAEVAGVIGHELEHAARRHPVRQMTAQQQTQAAALGGAAMLGILLGMDPGKVSPAVAVPATLAAQGYLPKYSRDQEREAGRLGALLSSHPVTSERIAATREEAAKFGPSPARSGTATGQSGRRFSDVQAHLGCERGAQGRQPTVAPGGAPGGGPGPSGPPAPPGREAIEKTLRLP